MNRQLAFTGYSKAHKSYEVFLYDLASRNASLLTASIESLSGKFHPVWSPDGAYLAFDYEPETKHKKEIGILNVETGELRRLPAESDIRHPRWIRDGTMIASYAYARSIEIVEVATGIIERYKLAGYEEGKVAWSPDGWRVAYEGLDGDSYRLTVCDLRSGDTRFLTDRFIYISEMLWKDNGTLAVIGLTAETRSEYLYTITLNGEVNQLFGPFDSIMHSLVQLSPDGSQLIYFTNKGIPAHLVKDYPDGRGDLYIQNADGSGLRQLLSDAMPTPIMVWSPDQQMVACVTNRSFQAYVVNVADGTTQFVGERYSDPAWRPEPSA